MRQCRYFFKKANIFALAFVMVITIVFATIGVGCTEVTTSLDGVVILQVYGVGEYSSMSNTPALSHSFIELYNTTDKDVKFDGASLHYSEAGNMWSQLLLSGTIKSNRSFTIRCNEYGEFSQQEVTSYDMEWDVVIENKGVKVCLTDNDTPITTTNPNNVLGLPIDGYIDMVCACGSDDTVDAAEGVYITGQSKQKSVRRISSKDTNDNSADFTIINYSDVNGDIMDYFLPKSTSYGAYDPFEGSIISSLSSDLMVYEIYGTGLNNDTPVNRSFISLYNSGVSSIDLSDYVVAYCSDDLEWEVVELNGTIAAGQEFLIAGAIESTGTTVVNEISDADADIVVSDMVLDNKELSVCILYGDDITNSNIDKMLDDRVVDLIGASCVPFETNPILGLSKQKSARRVSTVDTNDNSFDFEIIDQR